jgi:hypothetical protein
MTHPTYHTRVALTTTQGNHVRYVPGNLARAMVTGGSAAPAPTPGRIKSITLTQPASTSAEKIGPPGEGRATGVKFWRWTHLPESGARVVEHHPRCFLIEPE